MACIYFFYFICSICVFVLAWLKNPIWFSQCYISLATPSGLLSLAHSCKACQWLPVRWLAPLLGFSREFRLRGNTQCGRAREDFQSLDES